MTDGRDLADRLRDALAGESSMRERAMFGRRCLLVDDAIDDDRGLGR
jgi:hypothetical protein